MKSCRICGCHDERACLLPLGGVCWWVEDDLCSACAPDPIPFGEEPKGENEDFKRTASGLWVPAGGG